MASLRARHSRSCKFATTQFENWPLADCTCKPGPSYFVDLGIIDGRHRTEPATRNRGVAERVLRKIQVLIDEGAAPTVRENIRFAKWADDWLASFSGKENTRRVYKTTLDYAKRAFGSKPVRELSTAHVRRFLTLIEEETASRRKPSPTTEAHKVAPGTLAKHLRQLSTCLEAAVGEGYAAQNPVRQLHKSQRPKVLKKPAVYFTSAELSRLWPELAGRPVYLALTKLAVTTGMRLGELLALRWTDCNLLDREIRVSRTFVAGLGEQPTTKSGEARTIDLNPQAAAVLEEWLTQTDGEGLVFERETGGFIDPSYVTKRVLYPALKRAGIAREGEHGRLRDFHSTRHTFAKLALEAEAPIVWVSQQLGHSSIVLTVNRYGSWERKTEKAQAAALAGSFPV